MAGVIAQSTNNALGVAGLAYKARIMPVRVLDFEGKGDVATIARGIRFATRHHAKVVNMSFEFDIGLTAAQIPDVISALRRADRAGVLLVAAAGNTEDTQVAYPARAKHTIGVGATTEHPSFEVKGRPPRRGLVGDEQTGHCGLDRLEIAADGGGCIGLGIERIDMTGSAVHP